MLRLSRLISDKMVIHKDKPCHIWGWADPGRSIEVTIGEDIVHGVTKAEKDGSFSLFLDPPKPGTEYELTVRAYDDSDRCECVTISDVAVGLVYIMCGQSNAGFPMTRVRDTFPEEWEDPDDNDMRTFKVIEHYAFDHIEEDVLTGQWKNVSKDTIDPWCAVGYFAAKKIKAATGYPVGIIDATFGGSPIAAWMSREMLEDYPDILKVADKYCDKAVVDRIEELNSHGGDWREALLKADEGVKGHWEQSVSGGEWKTVDLPAFFGDTKIGRFVGSIWFKKKFFIGDREDYDACVAEVDPDEGVIPFCEDISLTDKEAHLWLGTLNDADITYVNGTQVGRIEYCYPPRRYNIPAGVLKKGLNEVTIRLIVEYGGGRFTSHKLRGIFTGNVKRYIDEDDNECVTGAEDMIDLNGTWKYRIGAVADPPAGGGENLCYRPTSLYNGVLDPCLNYNVGAFLWYQGESNTGDDRKQYYDLSVKQIEGIRKRAMDPKLPYILARLPKFGLNELEGDGNGVDEDSMDGWSYIQMIQERLGQLPGVYTVDSRGLGEAYDLHPQDKKPLGERYADVILKL